VVIGVAVPPARELAHPVAEAKAQPLLEEALERARIADLDRGVLELDRPVAVLEVLPRLHAAEELEDVTAGPLDAQRAVDAGLAVVHLGEVGGAGRALGLDHADDLALEVDGGVEVGPAEAHVSDASDHCVSVPSRL